MKNNVRRNKIEGGANSTQNNKEEEIIEKYVKPVKEDRSKSLYQ